MKNGSATFSTIDIKKIIQKEYPKFYQKIVFVPLFFKFLKIVIGQDIINRFIQKNHHLSSDDFLTSALAEYNITVQPIGLSKNKKDNIQKLQNTIIVANHPVGGYDGLAFIHTIRNFIPSAKIIVNKILGHINYLQEVFIPISVFNNSNRQRTSKENKKKY